MAANGNALGPCYGLGQITVTTAGTPVLLSSGGSALYDAFGATTTNSPIVANTIKVHAASGNTGNFYLVFQGGNKGTTNNIALVVAPGTTEELSCPQEANPFSLPAYEADADTSGNTAIITAYRF